jgi:hypothetical protein
MRFARIGLFCGLLVVIPGWSKQLPTQQPHAASSSPAVKDPQAVSVLNQALTAAGGGSAVVSISDYTSTGTVTIYSGDQLLEGTVTVRGLHTTEVRMDSSLQTGMISWAVHQGVISVMTDQGAIISAKPNEPMAESSAFPYRTPLFPGSLGFPIRSLPPILAKSQWSLSYNGVTQIDGHSVHDIQVNQIIAAAATSSNLTTSPRSEELFIDTETFQMVMVREMLPDNFLQEIHYSDYRPISGVSMPFAINDNIAGHPFWTIHFNAIVFNTGLEDSSFVIQ